MQNSIIQDMLKLKNEVNVFHWYTKSYRFHKISGKLYKALSEKIDAFIEIAISLEKKTSSKSNKTETPNKRMNISIDMWDTNEQFVKALREYSKKLVDIKENHPAIMAARDDILSTLHVTIYLSEKEF